LKSQLTSFISHIVLLLYGHKINFSGSLLRFCFLYICINFFGRSLETHSVADGLQKQLNCANYKEFWHARQSQYFWLSF